jgi:hypothetical protein
VADPSLNVLVDFATGILADPVALLLTLALVAGLLILLVAWRIRRIRAQDIWSHQPFGKDFRPKWRR